jgi:hypothetical protein
MNPNTQREIMGRGCPVIAATLKGFRMQRGKGGPYLVAAENEDVTGLLLLELDNVDYSKLDQFPELVEGLYARQNMVVQAEDGRSIECFVYRPALDKWPADWR